MRASCIPSLALAWVALAAPAAAQFTYSPPGDLERPGGGSLRVGAGRVDARVYAPGMRFPLESGPAYANSQIYGHGGYMGPGGGQCAAANYAYPWHDNYCEERSWSMPLCPSGRGHQGQDIRPATCRDDHHWAVAAAAGTVTNIGSYSVYVTADDGTRYDYLHMRSVAVSRGQRVTRGQRLGRVSDAFGSSSTTVHLHFNIRQYVSGLGSVFVPTYMSLVRSYEALVGPPGWRAAFVEQSFPFARDPFVLAPREEVAGHIDLRNTGGATWRPGEVFLGTTEPRDGASPLAGPDWVGPNRPATVDRVVPPGEVGRFAFTVRAPEAPGDHSQFFGVVREGVAWFSDPGQGGPPDDQLQVRVTVDPSRCDAPDACGWLDEDGDGWVRRLDCDDGDADAGLACRCEPSRVERLAGDDRFATAVRVAERRRADAPSRGVVLVNGESGLADAPDALVGAALAGAEGWPLLLTAASSMPAPTAEALMAWADAGTLDELVVVGGAPGVPDAQLAPLERRGVSVERIAGADRGATAAAVAEVVRARTGAAEVVIAPAAVDGVAGVALASALGAPLLLAGPDGLGEAARARFEHHPPSRAYLIGGGVPAAVEEALGAADVVRLEGSDRAETAARVADVLLAEVIARGGVVARASLSSWEPAPDVLGAATLGAPVFPSRPRALPDAVRAWLAEHPPRELDLVGGPAGLGPDLEADACVLLDEAGPGPDRPAPGTDGGPGARPGWADAGPRAPGIDPEGPDATLVGGCRAAPAGGAGVGWLLAWLALIGLARRRPARERRARRRAPAGGRASRVPRTRRGWGVAVTLGTLGALLAGCQGDRAAPARAPAPLEETWRSPSGPTLSEAVRARLSAASRRALAEAPTERVLLPPDALLDDAVITSGPGFYAVSARAGELTISLHAVPRAHHAAVDGVHPSEPGLTVRGRPARTSTNDGIRALSWVEDGVAIALEVECFDARTDPRCAERAFVVDLARRLTTVAPGG
ncbi:MAG TPA: cell wall-binding repeat-containing protein [Sandaracinaceae bacterium LLY-WYZ-13_1]|nr:cell wall-binding repeat-containing protein [Sandaracinaceae bacterium LLY-WYZ-13_1]